MATWTQLLPSTSPLGTSKGPKEEGRQAGRGLGLGLVVEVEAVRWHR